MFGVPFTESTYRKLRKRFINTGDLVLFSGGGFTSKIIRWATRSKYSHIGIFVRDPENDVVYIMESTMMSTTEDIFGNMKNGVQISLASQRLSDYDGKSYYRKLTTNRNEEFYKIFKKFRKEMYPKKYEKNWWELACSALDFGWSAIKERFQNKANINSVFCSEMVAEIYQRWGLIRKSLPSNEFTPADFSLPSNILIIDPDSNLSDLIEVIKK